MWSSTWTIPWQHLQRHHHGQVISLQGIIWEKIQHSMFLDWHHRSSKRHCWSSELCQKLPALHCWTLKWKHFPRLNHLQKWWMGTWQHRLPWTTEQKHTSESWWPPSETAHQKRSCGIVPTSKNKLWRIFGVWAQGRGDDWSGNKERDIRAAYQRTARSNRSRLLAKSNPPLFFQQVFSYHSWR